MLVGLAALVSCIQLTFPALAPIGQRNAGSAHSRSVIGVPAARMSRVVAEQLRAVCHLTGERAGVGVEEQLVRVAAEAAGRLERASDPVAVRLARADARHEAVPDALFTVWQRHLCLVAVGVEQAEPDLLGDAGSDREVHAAVTGDRAEGRAVPRDYLEDLTGG
jgi:hypothetical protein